MLHLEKNKFINTVKNYFPVDNALMFIFISFLVNIIWAYFSIPSVNPYFSFSHLYYLHGDSLDYVSLAENAYSQGCWCSAEGPSDYRMPGYLVFYSIFRFFFNANSTLNLIIILQLLLSAISKYYLAKLAYKIYNNYIIFILTFLLFNLTNTVTFFNLILYTEGIATALIIFFIYTLYNYYNTKQTKWLVVSSLLFLEIFLLRPFMGILLPCTIFLLYLIYKTDIRRLLIHTIIFCSPFLIFEMYWVGRNYVLLDKFQPFETSITQGRNTSINSYSLYSQIVKDFGGNELSWSRIPKQVGLEIMNS
ncbi:MAG: hypothetical protein M0D57_17550 [Sphingobacteriales bacterium JAD_PAG50586_3]|nr:MAG: hypothetical protein M0D57_17550 [Sphingobacteriales bacterium JAD_PAG50586_3]